MPQQKTSVPPKINSVRRINFFLHFIFNFVTAYQDF